jgi:hypothetical protein
VLPPSLARLDRRSQYTRVFPLAVLVVFAAAGLGYAACILGGVLPGTTAAWLAFVLAAIIVGAAVVPLLERLLLAPARLLLADMDELRGTATARAELERELAERMEQQRRLRHDLRGALSPVLLVADRLIAHPDPAVQRSGDIMVRTVERATGLLSEPSPPAGP